MNMKHINYIILSAVLTLCAACGQSSTIQSEVQTNDSIIAIREQGSFLIGGTVKTAQGTYDTNQPLKEDGQTLHGDHAYVSYQIPANTRKYPLVFLHGAGQSAKTWESTPDGREGFATLFLRRDFSTYLIDQPRRGRAGRSTVDENIKATPDDQFWFENFRMGIWPNYYENSQFPQSEESLDQFFRQMTPDISSHDMETDLAAVDALFDRIGKGVIVTHSAGGFLGWMAAVSNPNIKAVVSYEPGGYIFPEGEVPEPISGLTGTLRGTGVPMEDFMKLTKIPIVIYFGDYIPEKVTDKLGGENWRTRLQMGRKFVEAVNRHGGDATLVELPKIGIHGNTHFMMSDLNNIEIADLLSECPHAKGLD